MIWNQYVIKTTTADCDLVCAVLTDYGITDVRIENNIQLTDEELNQMYADFVKELPEDDGSCTVTFYLDEKGYIPEGVGTGDSPSAANEAEGYEGIHVDIREVEQGLKEARELFGIAPVTMEESRVDTEDWDHKWKEYFKPFTVGRILIKPTWEEVPEGTQADAVISIDPGMAFGTGIHETTRLCLSALQDVIRPGMTVLDLGTGSGILGIAALLLGADSVTAVDIDEQAVRVAGENFSLNVPGKKSRLITANILQDSSLQDQFAQEGYDLVLANILAEVIIPLSGTVHRFLKPGGVFIASGIIDGKEEDVVRAVRSNQELSLLKTGADGDWRSVIAEKRR
ncbi:MAG: 50S ribosomal protein L11 methyltransferase [Parasporobacterium sp.]|nr:50S ribosomal protein L11 methyltransferase [Parasporobacterium sp.]